MPFDSDVALIGTGLAPLIAAHKLIREGRSVLLLNPDRDFFLEDSELPLDPTAPDDFDRGRFVTGDQKHILSQLSPEYPGSLESWLGDEEVTQGFRDPLAPHVRGRSRIWAFGLRALSGDTLERFYVGASDAGLSPQLHQGLAALRRFPGASARSVLDTEMQAVLIPRRWDADVDRYRSGVLEFLRERLEADRILCGVSQIETTPDGVRFYSEKHSHAVRIKEGILVYWTPRMSSWIQAQDRKFSPTTGARAGILPELGVRLWEDWTLTSRDPLDPGVVGVVKDAILWADFDGTPSRERPSHRLRVLRPAAGASVSAQEPEAALDRDLGSSESLRSLTELCQEFLKWEKFAVRSVRPRLLMDWKRAGAELKPMYQLRKERPFLRMVTSADGSLADIVSAASSSCADLAATLEGERS